MFHHTKDKQAMLNSTPTKDQSVDRKFTLYLNEDDRDEIENLREALTPVVAKLANRKEYMDKHGRLSVAGMFRYLRHQEMKKRGVK
jgi:hypothetical protein